MNGAVLGHTPVDARPRAGSLSDRSALAIGISAMVAFVLCDAGTRAGWLDAPFGLGGSVAAAVIYVATLVRAHLDGGAASRGAARRPASWR